MKIKKEARLKAKKLLLMGSSSFKARELPPNVRKRIDEAIACKTKIIVGEAQGASRLFQDYLHSRGYRNVIVGHAIRMTYNAAKWKDVQ